MALHGQLMVNGHVIGSWQARRTVTLTKGRVRYPYKCRVWIEDGNREVAFDMVHDYTEGALPLAAQVLIEANRKFKEKK